MLTQSTKETLTHHINVMSESFGTNKEIFNSSQKELKKFCEERGIINGKIWALERANYEILEKIQKENAKQWILSAKKEY